MSGIRVLLVDDEPDFVAVLAERLESRNVAAETASDGAGALARATETRFDAVLLDMAMPGMDGVETLRRLLDVNPDLQVILLTGRSTVRQAAEVMKLGAMDLLEKPAEIEVIVDRIEQAAARSVQLFEQRTEQATREILRKKGW